MRRKNIARRVLLLWLCAQSCCGGESSVHSLRGTFSSSIISSNDAHLIRIMSSESPNPESSNPQPPPVEEQTNEQQQQSSGASFGGWLSNFVQSAKDTVVNKSAGTFESIKRDLSEFKDAVQTDTTSMVYSTASLVKSTLTEIGNTVNEIGSLGTNETNTPTEQPDASLKESADDVETPNESPTFNLDTLNEWTNKLTSTAKSTISMVKETLSDSMFLNRNFLIDELNDEPFVIRNGQIVSIDKWNEMLYQLQVDADTYCREPSGAPEDFDTWLSEFNLINYHKQMEHLLENIPVMKKFHADLVPKTISDSDFWHRYYYKVHQLREEQKRLILKADLPSPSSAGSDKGEPVNVKYLSETRDTDSKVSRSSTDEWEKMTDPEPPKETDSSKQSSDDDRDWVKCE